MDYFSSLLSFATDSGLSAKEIGMIIGMVLGPGGVAGLMKWLDQGKTKGYEERLAAKDDHIKGLQGALSKKDEEIVAIKEEAHTRNKELIAELRTVLPKLEQNTTTIKESSETMKKVVDWMESSHRLNQEEVKAFGEMKETMRRAQDALVAIEAKYLPRP